MNFLVTIQSQITFLYVLSKFFVKWSVKWILRNITRFSSFQTSFTVFPFPSWTNLNPRFHGWNSMTRLRNPRLLRINAAGCEKSRLQICASLHFHRSKSWYRVNLTFVKGETLDQKRWLARPEKITWRIDRFTGVMVRDLVWYLADGIFVWSVEDGWGGERDCKVSTRVFTDLVAPLFSKSRYDMSFYVFGIRGNQRVNAYAFNFHFARFLQGNVNGVSFSIFLLFIIEN